MGRMIQLGDTASDSTFTTPGEWSGAGEMSAWVQPLTAHRRQLVNGAGRGREVCPGTASDSTLMTPGKRSRARERDTASGSTFTRPGKRSGAGGESSGRIQPLTALPIQLVNGTGLGREFSPGTASDSTPMTPGERSRTRKRVLPGTASYSTPTITGERSRAGERGQPGYSL